MSDVTTIDDMYSPIQQLVHATRLLISVHAYERDAGEDLTGATDFLECLALDLARRVEADSR